MIAQYKPNEKDQGILSDITGRVVESLEAWYGHGSHLDERTPQIRSYRNSFMLRYIITLPSEQKKTVLVKIRRNPKMDSLLQAIQADIHQNIPNEFRSLEFVYQRITNVNHDFGAIRPLSYFDPYFAIVMEEYPSRTLRQLLNEQRSSRTGTTLFDLKDAARKTGRWLDFFHQQIHIPIERDYPTGDIFLEVQSYAERLESASHGRINARSILAAFSKKLENIHVDRMTFSQSHADMTCDNVLYSEDRRVCIIDIKTRLAPIYADLGLLLIHPETFKQQIFSGGKYYPESLLQQYRTEIVAGYCEAGTCNQTLVRVFSAVKVLDKWLMYQELMSRYKGMKRLVSRPLAPLVTGYFQNLLNKYLELIKDVEPGQALKVKKLRQPARLD